MYDKGTSSAKIHVVEKFTWSLQDASFLDGVTKATKIVDE